MALAAQPGPERAPAPSSLPQQSTQQAAVSEAQQVPVVPEAQSAPVAPETPPAEPQPQTTPAPVQPTLSATPTAPAPTSSSSPKPAEPSSLESSWSFGNLPPERSEADASSSAVAGSSAEGQNVTKRTVTVEDAEDNEQ